MYIINQIQVVVTKEFTQVPPYLHKAFFILNYVENTYTCALCQRGIRICGGIIIKRLLRTHSFKSRDAIMVLVNTLIRPYYRGWLGIKEDIQIQPYIPDYMKKSINK